MPCLKIQQQLRAVVHGIPHRGDSQLIGADDCGRGRIEGAGHAVSQTRFQAPGLLSVYYAQLLHSVLQAPGVELLYALPVFVSEAYDQGTVPAVRHAQFLCDLLHHPGALYIQLCFQASLFGVISRVGNTGVGPGGTHPHIAFLFQNTDLQVVGRQRPGQHSAYHPCAYDCYVIHIVPMPFFCHILCQRSDKIILCQYCTMSATALPPINL